MTTANPLVAFGSWRCNCTFLAATLQEVPARCPEHGAELLAVPTWEENPHGVALGLAPDHRAALEARMLYRCNRCHAPMAGLTCGEDGGACGACRCGGLIEAHPQNFAVLAAALPDPATASRVVATEIFIPGGSQVFRLLPDGFSREEREQRDDLLTLGFPHDEGGWVYEHRGSRFLWEARQ